MVLVDAGLRHLRIGDDVAAGAQRLNALRDRVVGEDEIVGIVKVGSRVDGALDDELVFRVELTVSQQLGDDLEAAALNVHRFDLFQHGVSPFGTRPESGRQRMDSRKMEMRDSPRRGVSVAKDARPAAAGGLRRREGVSGLLRIPVVEFVCRDRLSRAAERLSRSAVSVT